MDIKAAIFDMDGTLVDSLFIWDVLWARLGERFLGDKNFHPKEADDKAVRILTLSDAMALIHNNYGIGESADQLLDETNCIMRQFYSTEVKLKKGVLQWLDHCRSKGVRMCVASATAPDLVQLAVEHCGIEGYFERFFSCSDIGKGKDEPDIFLAVCEYLGTCVQETFVFEDSLVAIETATKIGMPTVGIYDRNNFGQERIAQIATEYIADGEDLTKLI